MANSRYAKRITLSKAQIDTEMRNVVRKVAHRPIEEIEQIIRERMHVAVDREYLKQLVAIAYL